MDKYNALFSELNINSDLNLGACAGLDWLDPTTKVNLHSVNPSDETILAKVKPCDTVSYEAIVKKASDTFEQWRQMPAPKRGEIVRQIAEQLRKYKTALATLVSLEMGKTLQEGLGEVQEMIDMADFAVGQSRMLYGNTMHSERPRHRMYEQWHPIGVVGIITAFNFPVAVWAWNAFIAAIAGNTVIWKPSSKTPLCAIAVQHICNDVMRKNNLDGIFSLTVFNDRNLADLFIEDIRIALVSFTGSTETGRGVAERVARRLGRSLLELGGNNAIIVDETADMNLVIPAIVFSAIGTSGQRCTTVRRLIIHESIYKTVLEKLKHAYEQIKIGTPLITQNLMGPLVDEQAVNGYLAALQRIKALGGEIIHGGQVLETTGYFVQPTLVRAENYWDMVQRETFAPILYLLPYQQFDNAIAMQNAAKHGLSSALFSQSHKNIEHYLSVIGSDCGIANINIGTSGAEIGGAFGGEKETGGGREAGSDAWKQYMRRQTNTINWGGSLPLAQGIEFKID